MNFLSLFKRNILYKLKKKIYIDFDKINKKTLDDFFIYYGSDKASLFTKSDSKGHGFSKFYTRHLNHLKNNKINILEIGSYAGASAAAFIKYFPNSTVYCFDINISKIDYSSNKMNVYGLDINNKKKLHETLNKIIAGNEIEFFDIIIDDGSHYLSDILLSLKTFFKYIKNKGLYIVEDYKHPNYYSYNKNVDDIFFDQVLKNLKENKIFDSNIIGNEDQQYLFNAIKTIYTYKGDLKDSDICFIEKN